MANPTSSTPAAEDPGVPPTAQPTANSGIPQLGRRSLLGLAGGAAIAGGAYVAGVVPAYANPGNPGPGQGEPEQPARQFRAIWIASVENIDWPSSRTLTVEEQQAEFIAWLDLAVELNLNAVISQVRPTADAFWRSPYEPWSHWLTGEQGKDPGYDPLAFQIEEAHKRNLEYHAWYNPYRVATHSDPSRLVPEHIARQHPDWVWAYGGKLYFDPGLPEVQEFVRATIIQSVEDYDVDAVHFDDYFYPYVVADPDNPEENLDYPDQDTYARYGQGQDVGDWRRDNINQLVRDLHRDIHDTKPWVKFGISPFGIWRNDSSDPRGSATSGSESYEIISADSRRWVKEGWVDYINPQIYWQIGLEVADYAALVPWWADVVKDTDVALYIGQAAYKAVSGVFTDPEELANHLTFNADHPEVDGDVYFSAKSVRDNPQGAVTELVEQHYQHPAIVPVIRHLGGRRPKGPKDITLTATGDGVQVSWQRDGGATSYAVWRSGHPSQGRGGHRTDDGANLLATLRGTEDATQSVTLTGEAAPRPGESVFVTAYDRLWNESKPSRPSRL
ncbi:glycoside hydrolase family 10 protein [Parenemella sanctibonifatiensis]|uniref:Glycosyl hydrolase n=1 Tax=Parenemella sanctibonifatiensis TaxID=2016505 RepID=A0A255EHD2_9ACTN|nr:family 10 glycosylhydrolase [Parenemella sanctibonifatiensis]OYN88832.1 glycosyl hydrolase [Parenemella sanctibonifatiensis]